MRLKTDKVMEIPEKIYLPVNPDTGSPCYRLTGPKDNYIGSVEYTRTDAFIEKALAYLNEKFYFNNLHYAVENNTFNCMEEMFEDFKNYIKGN